MILELEMNTGERFQFFIVPRRIAIGLVQADEPAKYMKEFIERAYRFERVRGRYYTKREILMEIARGLVWVSTAIFGCWAGLHAAPRIDQEFARRNGSPRPMLSSVMRLV
jgi:hypothetical protein